ncbi:unnamed protein product [Fusarium fujikuroi]|nr:unnamed protein product [Fusarium fujikuroi]
MCYSDQQTDIQNLVLDILFALRSLPATGHGTLRSDLLGIISAAASNDFDYDRTKPLLKAALADDLNDYITWDQVCNAVTEPTPPPRPTASCFQQTQWLRNTSSFANSSEHRKYVDDVLKEGLGTMYIGIRNFHDVYFGVVTGLETASQMFFKQCLEDSDPLFKDEWRGWPKDANQDGVLSWLAKFSEKLAAFATVISQFRRINIDGGHW